MANNPLTARFGKKLDEVKARELRELGDRERLREKAAIRDGDFNAAVDHERKALNYYREARALEFGDQ